MKKFFIPLFFLSFFCVARSVFAFDIPAKPQSFVNDYANILSQQEKSSLENKISAFEKQTTDEIAVVILPSLDGDTIENVAQNIFTKWGIGKKDKNNGILLLISMAEHQARIHTGYGAEGDLTDLATSYIQSEVLVPAFRQGNYYAGINGSVDKIIESLGGANIVPDDYASQESSGINWNLIFFFGIVLFQLLVAILGRSKSWWGGGVLGAVVGGIIWYLGWFSLVYSILILVGLIVFGLGFDFAVSRAYQRGKMNGHFPWWIGGGWGGRGGGGFGGFGGGMSGGGGSSSSW